MRPAANDNGRSFFERPQNIGKRKDGEADHQAAYCGILRHGLGNAGVDARDHEADTNDGIMGAVHLRALRHAEPLLKPVRLSRDEVERVDVLMRLIDERTAKQG